MDHSRTHDWEKLRNTIAQWNDNRLDLFELSEPDQQLNFHGVMRFYYQDSGQKVSTKCIRVSSDATASNVIDTLMEKFRPDMRMLSTPRFALYEIHESGEERELDMDERPLHVQLHWHQDDREGRFLLRNLNDKPWPLRPGGDSGLNDGNFKRKLSKRQKKELKKKEKLQKVKSSTGNDPSVAEKLYTELPETSFTRSISNPEAVMRRRRQQKLEKKLQQYRSRDGGPDTGGTLKIYGESLCSDVPYKTLLLSVSDTAANVVVEMLKKYGKYRDDPADYCLVQVVTQEPQLESREYHAPTGPYNEHILEDDECPLAILINHPPTPGSIMFHVRRRPSDYQPRKRKKIPNQPASLSEVDHSYRGHDESSLPFLVELNSDGSDVRHMAPRRYSLRLNVTEVGSERSPQAGGQCLQLAGHNVHPRHCVIAHTEGIVTVTPCGREAETYVNGQRVYETTILQHGCVVQFGRVYRFRFLDPSHEERLRGRRDPARVTDQYAESHSAGRRDSMETTFDVTGNVETRSTSSQRHRDRDDTASQRSDARTANYASFRRGSDPILPAVLEFREETEDAFLHAVVTRLDPSSLQFKLAPTYTLYMAARFRASTHYRSDLTPNERALRLTNVLAKVSSMIRDVIQMRRSDANSLAFWMANASEYLHFLKQDRHVSAYSRDAQDILAESVRSAFWYLVDSVQAELAGSIGQFLDDRDDADEEEGTTAQVLSSLGNTMALLRRCRVNAALTIQLFSQLFHYINMGVFNMLVLPGPVNYCSRMWGERLKRRLSRTELWADRQGLELAADCHLGRVVQAAHLLTAPKNNVDDLTGITSTCYKLNSLQLRTMLERYMPASDEPARIPPQLIDNIVRIAESTSDELARQDGRPVRLEESRDLQLPFLLPEDGYSSDIVRGIPNGLSEFIAPLQHAGLARMNEQPTSWGYWTIYMAGQDQAHPMARSPSAMSNRSVAGRGAEPDVQLIKLHKSNSGMGLSIVAAKGVGQDQQGIYVKSVVRGGAADADGRLAAGDLLLEVDGHSLAGISQEQAAEYMMKTGQVVLLKVAKQAAVFHRLTALLSQPSPNMSRSSRRASERGGIPPSGRIQSSKSVPVLSADADREPPTAAGRHHEMYNPGFNLSASNASLAALPTGPLPPSHARSRSVQNLHKPAAAAGPGPAPPPRPISVHAHHQPLPAQMGPSRPEMPRSVSDHEHLRYGQPNAGYDGQVSGSESLLPPHSAAGGGTAARYADRQLHPHARPENGSAANCGDGLPPPQHTAAAAGAMSPYGERLPPPHAGPVGGPPIYGERQPAPVSGPGSVPLPFGERQAPPPHFTNSSSVTSPYGEHTPPRSRPGEHRNSHSEHRNSQSERNSYSEQRNNHERRNSQSEQRNSHSEQRNSQSEQRSSQSEQRNSQSEHNSSQGEQAGFGEAPMPPPQAARFGEPSHLSVRFEEPAPARPPPPQDMYGDLLPPPPPPPPASTHPLYGQVPQRPPPPTQHTAAYDPANPWNREEREKDVVRRTEAARHWRDQHIARLEATPNRSRREQQQLDTLLLEKRFQQRMELAGDDDDENDDEPELDVSRSGSDGPAAERQTSATNRHEEVRQRQAELEAAHQAEQGILREAQRRRDQEEARLRSRPPAPPGRTVSFGAVTSSGELRPPVVPPKPEVAVASVVSTRRVQLSEPPPPPPPPPPPEDPDRFLDEAEQLMAASSISPPGPATSPDTSWTPGVIGAQEVYRDPRTRRLAQLQDRQRPDHTPVPEKLSFKEKMKMFAAETG